MDPGGVLFLFLFIVFLAVVVFSIVALLAITVLFQKRWPLAVRLGMVVAIVVGASVGIVYSLGIGEKKDDAFTQKREKERAEERKRKRQLKESTYKAFNDDPIESIKRCGVAISSEATRCREEYERSRK